MRLVLTSQRRVPSLEPSPHSAAPRFPLVAPRPPVCSRSLSRSCSRPAHERIDMSFSIFTMLDDLDSATIRSVGSLPLFFNSLVFGHFKPSGFKVPFLRKRLLCSGNVNCCRNAASPSLTRIRGLAFLFVVNIYSLRLVLTRSLAVTFLE